MLSKTKKEVTKLGSSLNNKNWVVKQNSLNEMRTYDMNLQELRLFSVYLSKINPQNKETRAVRFSLADFQAIMELKSPNVDYFKKIARSLLTKVVFEPLESGGFDAFTIFNRFRVVPDENGNWCVDVDANELALPLLFDFKGRYFKYELWNALRLKSKNQLRMYEVLKQYEKTGYRVLSIEKLKEMLGIKGEEYPRFNTFKQAVLDVCQRALKENTDITFTYEPYGKKGKGGKILELKFLIIKNKDYKSQLSLDEFIDMGSELNGYEENLGIWETNKESLPSFVDATDSYEENVYEERISFLMEACDDEFTREEVIVIYSIMQQKFPHIHANEIRSYDFLRHKYREFLLSSKKTEIKKRYNYFKKLVEAGEN